MWCDWQISHPDQVTEDDVTVPRLVGDREENFAEQLDVELARVLTYIGGDATVAQVAKRSGIPLERVRAAVHKLVTLGAVSLSAS